jgi:hypothetical protein
LGGVFSLVAAALELVLRRLFDMNEKKA